MEKQTLKYVNASWTAMIPMSNQSKGRRVAGCQIVVVRQRWGPYSIRVWTVVEVKVASITTLQRTLKDIWNWHSKLVKIGLQSAFITLFLKSYSGLDGGSPKIGPNSSVTYLCMWSYLKNEVFEDVNKGFQGKIILNLEWALNPMSF